ncbi:MAG: sortase [Lachnospiraceae bacterium]|nr:sortase [Lachnospiraceae bacterium]
MQLADLQVRFLIERGNLCIAAHNYNDNRFFSKIHNLDIGDRISIYDENGNMLEYSVYNKYTIESTDSNCASQETNGTKEITLVTCNNITGFRFVVKAREISS